MNGHGELQILPVQGIGEVLPGADLADLIARAAPWLCDGDVLVVTSKIVSKAEGRLVEVPADPGPARDRAHTETVAAETARTVATRGATRIVATHHGFVLAAAGVDASNVDTSRLVLLPKDPDGSARALRAALARRCGKRVAVVISDTMGRPWRIGLTDTALGAAGIQPLHDHRGQTDRYGNQLQLTQVAVVDELAAAADLVKGKTGGVPVAVVRGLPADRHAPAGGAGPEPPDGPGVVATLVRDSAEDLFSLGTAEARAAGLRAAATLPDLPPAPAGGRPALAATRPPAAAVQRALATVATVVAPGTALRHQPGPPAAVLCRVADPGDPAALVRFGADVHRLRSALAAEQVGSVPEPADDPGTLRLLLATADS